MDLIDEANKAAYRETKFLIEKARKATVEKLHPKGSCHNCGAKIKKKAANPLFCDADCRDDFAYYNERKKINKG